MSGVQHFRLNHELNSDSIVFEVGGFTGDFSSRIIERFDCYVYIFEPIMEYYEHLKLKYNLNTKIKVFNYIRSRIFFILKKNNVEKIYGNFD